MRNFSKQFIIKAKAIHGNKYNYSKVNYKNNRTKVTIICSKHGEFLQTPTSHLQGHGCPSCAGNKIPTTEEFIQKAIAIHGTKYNYNKVQYKNDRTKVIIICPIHGEFRQSPRGHLQGKGCAACADHSLNIDQFVKQAQLIHGEKYDYSKIEYVNASVPVRIICPIHGEFWQKTNDHLRYNGCPECVLSRSRLSQKQFEAKAAITHNNKYSYGGYEGQQNKIRISCPIHGDFWQKANDHLQGHGCRKCSRSQSRAESDIIAYIKSLGYEVRHGDRKIIAPLELDITIPGHKIAIEHNGLYWHSYNDVICEDKLYHVNKTNQCEESGWQLIHIFEHEWRDKTDIIKSKLSHLLGCTANKIYARQCKLVIINNKKSQQFFNSAHIQGHRHARHIYALVYDDDIIAAASFSPSRVGYELIRYAVKPYYAVTGGFSRLFKQFMSDFNPDFVITYADRRFSSTNNVYNSYGELLTTTKPNYYYVKNGWIFSRQQFQKHKLHKKLANFDPKLTEAENMFINGYRRFWDCGHFKYKLVNKRQI